MDWWPWGPEALAHAVETDRPILLSIGYASCHWCHVMGSESFENPEVAEFINAHFVLVKVDREQHLERCAPAIHSCDRKRQFERGLYVAW